jgi:hypothetical protein
MQMHLGRKPAPNAGRPADALQRPLRSRFWARLRPSVDMTSDVKGWEQLFYVCILIFPFCLSEESEPV